MTATERAEPGGDYRAARAKLGTPPVPTTDEGNS